MARVRPFAHIDPRLASALETADFFPSVITIYSVWTSETPSGDEGELAVDLRSALAGHVNLNCQIAPLMRVDTGELRRPTGVIEETTHLILLPGPYPLILPHYAAVTGDGEIYDLTTRDIDAFNSFTRIEARQVFPAALAGR